MNTTTHRETMLTHHVCFTEHGEGKRARPDVVGFNPFNVCIIFRGCCRWFINQTLVFFFSGDPEMRSMQMYRVFLKLSTEIRI